MAGRLAALALSLLVGAGGAALAGRAPPPPSFSPGPPLLLQLEGVIEASPAAAKKQGFAVASLGFVGSDARRWLGVTRARTVGGDHPLDGKDVLAIVAPFRPNFLVAGAEALVARLRDAPPGTVVRVEGLVSSGSRTYHLRSVERRESTSARHPRAPHSALS